MSISQAVIWLRIRHQSFHLSLEFSSRACFFNACGRAVGECTSLGPWVNSKQGGHTTAIEYADQITRLYFVRSKTNVTLFVLEEFSVENYSQCSLQELLGERVGAVINHLDDVEMGSDRNLAKRVFAGSFPIGRYARVSL